MARIFVHAGLPKTATTTLQQQLFPHLPGVTYLGPKGREEEQDDLVAAARTVIAAVRFQARTLLSQGPPAELLRARDRLLAVAGPVLLSDEGLTAATWRLRHDAIPLMPVVLRRLFGDAAAAILVFREPLDQLASLLLQKMANGPVWRPTAAGNVLLGPAGLADLHLQGLAKGDLRSVLTAASRWDRIAAAYRDALGPRRVHLLAYERLFDGSGGHGRAFPAVLGTARVAMALERRNASTEDRRRAIAERFYGPAADERRIRAFVDAWGRAAEILGRDPALCAFLDAHCRDVHREALAATEALLAVVPA
ncbi:MAG: hypothetical protein IT561_02915 [Alphaproteobacteria bacterium]|nr:hypothetical protein [Alphaproteobacteria bacterium]